MDLATAVGTCAAALVFLTFATRTMVPLRVLGMASNVAFIAYGALAPALPILILHTVLLPLNAVRLHQMLRLTRQVATASRGDLDLDWLKPFCDRRRIAAGDVLFTKGEPADRLAFVLSGRLHIAVVDVALGPGHLAGELGMIVPNGLRTQTVTCTEAAELLEITYDQIRRLYFQNPAFGFYFLQLTTRRLFENIERLEKAQPAGSPVPARRGPPEPATAL